MKVLLEEGVGIPAHFHYDPYFNRYKEHVKRLVYSGNPIIVRLHPGTTYPMKDDTLHYRVDREGHVVSIIGYDDSEQAFILADPWNNENGGEKSGIYKMPYTEFEHKTVDGTLDAMTIPVPWDMFINIVENQQGGYTIEAEITYTAPTPISKSYNHLHETHVKLNLPTGINIASYENSVKLFGEEGNFAPGESYKVSWDVELTEKIENEEISIQVRGLVSSDDPYSYMDVIGSKGVAEVTLTPTTVSV